MLAEDKILVDALALSPKEKLQLVEQILTSLHPVNKGVDSVWAQEADERVVAFNAGNVHAVESQKVFEKYNK